MTPFRFLKGVTVQTKKKFAFFGVAALGALAGVLALFPQSLGFAPLAKGAQELAREAAENIPDECPFECDAGRGTIRPLDGGVRGICECR